jgi:hypothetical protein
MFDIIYQSTKEYVTDRLLDQDQDIGVFQEVPELACNEEDQNGEVDDSVIKIQYTLPIQQENDGRHKCCLRCTVNNHELN